MKKIFLISLILLSITEPVAGMAINGNGARYANAPIEDIQPHDTNICEMDTFDEKLLISKFSSGDILSLAWDSSTSKASDESNINSNQNGFIDISYDSSGRLFGVNLYSHIIELNPITGTFLADKGAIAGSTFYGEGDYPAVALVGDKDGYLYSGVSKNGRKAIVKFKPDTPSITELVAYTDNTNDGGDGGDLAWSGGYLYQTIYNTESRAINLVKINVDTKQIIYNKIIKNEYNGTFSTGVIPMYNDSTGTLFVIEYGNIYKVDTDTLIASYVSGQHSTDGRTGATTTYEACAGKKSQKIKPFACDGTMYFSNETELGTVDSAKGGMYLHSINKSKSPFSFDKIGQKYDKTYNALAYNPKDDFLYATYNNILLQIDSEGEVKDLGAISGLAFQQNYSATFDKDGYYYLGDWQDRTKIYKIDVKTKTIIETMYLESSLNFIDMTISQNGSEKYLYVLNRSDFNTSGGKKNQLVKINISNKQSNGKYGYETIGDKVAGEAEADSVFYDASGKLYVLFHKGGFYEIDTTTGKRIPISSAPELADLNDGAICPNATIKLKPTITFGDATVVEGDSGTTELLFPYSLINNENPKSLTFRYSVSDGNSTDSSINAKSSEDFVQTVPTTVVQEKAHDGFLKVAVKGDTKLEKDEILQLLVSDITGALFVKKSAQGTIINDDNSNQFIAYDIADANKKIKTKIVKSGFSLTLAKLDSHGNLTTSGDENSTKVRVVDSSKCSVPFDGDMSGFVSFDMGTSAEITSPEFNSSIAMKHAKVQFYWKDVLGEHTSCLSDTFAIRPDHYDVSVPINIVAGKDFNITVKAMSADNSLVSNYQELSTVYRLDINDTKANIGCALGLFSKNVKTDFVGGVSKVTLNYNNVGKLKFKVIEKQLSNTEYANIDKGDGSLSSRFIISAETNSTITPAKIKALFNFKTQNSLPFTYYGDNPYEVGALIEANITMLSENNIKVTNFSDSCWASDVNITIDFAKLNGPTSTASFCDDDNPNLGNIISSNKISYKITKDKFTNANAIKKLYLNFGRDIKKPKDPIRIKLSSPKVTLSSSLTSSVVKEKIYTFVYARANSAPEQSVVGKTISAKIGYEAYIPKTIDRTLYGLNSLTVSENGENWYNIPIDSSFGYKVNPTLRYGAGAHISAFDKSSVTVNVIKTPHTNRVVYSPKDFLLFNRFNDNAKSHSFKITLYSNDKQWAGKGKKGLIMDNDISKNVVKKINW